MERLSNNRLFLIFKIFIFVCIIVLASYFSKWVFDGLNVVISSDNEFNVNRIIILSMIAYTLLMAMPFVPGAEIGLGVMMILGPKIVPLVYLCTVLSLLLSFVAGRLVPGKLLHNFLGSIHLQKACMMFAELEGLSPQERFNVLLKRAPKRFIPFLLNYRYLALIVVINTPGNIVVGGAGGIAMTAGMSRLFTPFLFILTVCIAVSPIPLFLLFFGADFRDWPI